MPADAPTDPFFDLLTDALRAGPASPAWRDAVAALREKGAKEADEYRLLISTRENLESGREYRDVRAGAGFTRKLMDRISGDEQQSGTLQKLPIANLVAAACGFAILIALGWVFYRVVSPKPQINQQAVDHLTSEANHFLTDVASATFTGTPPQGWKQIGSLPLDFTSALRPLPGQGIAGGGIYDATPIPADPSFMIEATVNAPTGNEATSTSSGQALWLQIFISTDANFSPDRATSSQEIAWSLQGTTQIVAVDGRVNTLALRPQTGSYPVRIILNRDLAVVQIGQRAADGKIEYRQAWAGAHHLGSGPRYAGVRFLRTQPTSPADVPTVTAIHIAKG